MTGDHLEPDRAADRERVLRRLDQRWRGGRLLRVALALLALAMAVVASFSGAYLAAALTALFAVTALADVRRMRPDDPDEAPVRMSAEFAAAVRERVEAEGELAAVKYVQQLTAASAREAARAVDEATGTDRPIVPQRAG